MTGDARAPDDEVARRVMDVSGVNEPTRSLDPSGDAALDEALTLADFDALARERLDRSAYDYLVGGSWDEITLRENVEAFRRRRLRPRVLVDISRIDTSTTILGESVAAPIALAPAAFQGIFHPDAEPASARAAAAAGLLFCLSTLSSRSIEEVADAAPDGLRWFQLYVQKDRGVTARLVERAAACGYRAIVVTVDLPVTGVRERDLRNATTMPPIGNFVPDVDPETNIQQAIAFGTDASLRWADLEWIRGLSDLPLVVKGILTGEDAALAVEHGARAIVVSNHGGRQLDQTPASIDVLEEVVEAVAGRAEVYLDGGVRRPSDVLVALGLGARTVFIGRPYLLALAAGGEAGVTRALRIFMSDLAIAMALLGVRSVDEVTRSHVA